MGDISQLILALARVGPTRSGLLGTCFAVGPKLVATALHAVGAQDENLVLLPPRLNALSDYQDTSDFESPTIPLKIVAANPFRDLCLLELPEGVAFTGALTLAGTDEIHPGSAVTTFGFPHADSGRVVLTQQTSTVGARILVANGTLKSKHVVLNVQTRPGQSGGPVLNNATGAVVAVVIGSYAPGGGGLISVGGVDPATLHQTTHAVSAEYVQEMLK